MMMTGAHGDDFDTFLAESIANEKLHRENDLYFRALDQRFQSEVDKVGLECLTNINPEVEADLQQAASMRAQNYLLDTAQRPDDQTYEEFEEGVRISAIQMINILAMREHFLIARTKSSVASYEYDYLHDKHFDAAEHTVSKKKFLAGLLIAEDYTTDDPWYIFVNTIIPGGVVDLSLVENQKYVTQAIENFANADEEKRKEKNALLLFNVRTAMGFSESDEQDDATFRDALQLSGKVIEIAMFERRQFERESQIYAACSAIGLGGRYVVAVLQLLEAEYPSA